VLQKLCGLLNNNVEGSIFFGLSADCIIEGLKLGREDKDVFRNGNNGVRITMLQFFKMYIMCIIWIMREKRLPLLSMTG
jgi:hypothetical protein